MSDLVERLRDYDPIEQQLRGLPIQQEAADEIERLREALHFYADAHKYPNDGPWGVNSDDFGRVARAALEGEK